jgi:hypothetical protein
MDIGGKAGNYGQMRLLLFDEKDELLNVFKQTIVII